MAATRVDGTGTNKRTPYLLYEVITNNATTYTLRLSLGVNNKNSGASGTYTATTESYISKKIGSGAAAFTYASSSVRVSYGDTVIISNTTWTITKTHASQSISIAGFPYLDHQTIGSVTKTLTVPAKTSYTVTYNANSGSGAPAQQTKWYNETLTLSSTKPTKAGYTFKGWATSEANAKAGTVAYPTGESNTYTGNVSLTLWAVWELTYSTPMITNLHVDRCDTDGDIDDEGTIARVTFDWSVFRSSSTRYYGGSTTPYTSTTVQSCSVTVGAVTKSVSLSGASGSTSNDPVIVGSDGSFLNDMQYNVSVTITDTVDSEIQPTHSSTTSTTLVTTFFPMDFNADATALGFFKPAPNNGDGVYFGKSINVTGTLTLNDEAMANFVTVQGYTTGGTGSHTWYYRKWASGMEEAWGVCSASAVTGSVWVSPIYYYNWDVTWPDIFTSAPTQCYITSRNDQWVPVGHGTVNKTGTYIRMLKPSSGAQALAVDIYLVHR